MLPKPNLMRPKRRSRLFLSVGAAESLKLTRLKRMLLRKLKSQQKKLRSHVRPVVVSAITARSPPSQPKIRKIRRLQFKLKKLKSRSPRRSSKRTGQTRSSKSLQVAKKEESDRLNSVTMIKVVHVVGSEDGVVVITRATLNNLPIVSTTTQVISRTTSEVVMSHGVVEGATTLLNATTITTRAEFLGSIRGLARSVLITLPQVMVGKKKWSRVTRTAGSSSAGMKPSD